MVLYSVQSIVENNNKRVDPTVMYDRPYTRGTSLTIWCAVREVGDWGALSHEIEVMKRSFHDRFLSEEPTSHDYKYDRELEYRRRCLALDELMTWDQAQAVKDHLDSFRAFKTQLVMHEVDSTNLHDLKRATETLPGSLFQFISIPWCQIGTVPFAVHGVYNKWLEEVEVKKIFSVELIEIYDR